MTIEGQFKVWNVLAAEDLLNAVGKAVTINGTIAPTIANAIGVLRGKGSTGQHLPAVFEGVTKVVVGAAVTTPGYPIKITTSGFFIAAASGDGHVGRLLNTAAVASGDLVPAMVNFMTKPAWAGV